MNIAKNQLTPRSPLFREEIREVVSAERGSGYVNEGMEMRAVYAWKCKNYCPAVT
jgi:hypothetical protein